MLDEVKKALRISLLNTAYDDEVTGLIAAAQAELVLAGVTKIKVNDTTDPLIKRAVVVYCKANFGWDNPDSEKFKNSFEMLKMSLSLAGDYNCSVMM